MLAMFKAIGRGVSHVFYKLILFFRVFTKLQVVFYRLKNFKLFLRYDQSKSGRITGSLWKGKTKTVFYKILFQLKLTSSYVFQVIFFKFLQSGLYENTKKNII